MLDRHRDIAHQLAEFLGQPVQRGDDHVFETAGFDLDHQSIVQRSGAATVRPGGIASHLIVPSTGRPLARCPPKAGPFPATGPVMMPLGASVRSRKILAAWSTSTTGPGKRFRETRRSDAITTLFTLARTWRIRSARTSCRARLVPVVVPATDMASLLSAF